MFGCVWICLGFNKKVLKWPFHATHCEWFVPSFEAAKNWGSAGPLQQVLQWTWKRPEISRDGAALIVLLMQFFIQCHWFAPVENGDLSPYRLEKLQAGAGVWSTVSLMCFFPFCKHTSDGFGRRSQRRAQSDCRQETEGFSPFPFSWCCGKMLITDWEDGIKQKQFLHHQ